MIDKIKEYMINTFQIDEDAITPDAHFVDDLQLTSLDIMDIAMYIEDEFGIVLDEEDLGDIATVQDFTDLLEKQQ